MVDDLAKKFLDTIPRAMQSVRAEIRDIAKSELTVPQFRTLAYLGRQGKSTNRELAEHLGVQASAMSRMVDGLIKLNFVKREHSKESRREVVVQLTAAGQKKYESFRGENRKRFAALFASLNKRQHDDLMRGLEVLSEIFNK